MTAACRPLTRSELEPLARAAAGPARRLGAVSRLRGGSKKGVYRLTFDDGGTAVAYVWSPDEDYWTGTEGTAAPDPRDPFSHASGIDLFTAAHDRLAAIGVRTPRLLLADRTGRHLPADAAVVEDVRGGTPEEALERDPHEAAGTLERLAGALATMRGSESARGSARSASSTRAAPRTAPPAWTSYGTGSAGHRGGGGPGRPYR